MRDVKINWIPVKDQLPNKVGPDLYEPVTFVTVQYSDTVNFVILNRIQYGVIKDKEFDDDKDEWVNGIGWRYYDKEMEEWDDYESSYDCKIIAWSRDCVEPYMEE